MLEGCTCEPRIMPDSLKPSRTCAACKWEWCHGNSDAMLKHIKSQAVFKEQMLQGAARSSGINVPGSASGINVESSVAPNNTAGMGPRPPPPPRPEGVPPVLSEAQNLTQHALELHQMPKRAVPEPPVGVNPVETGSVTERPAKSARNRDGESMSVLAWGGAVTSGLHGPVRVIISEVQKPVLRNPRT